MSSKYAHDETLKKVLESFSGMGTELQFINYVFGFLNRQSPKFLAQSGIGKQIIEIVNKHIDKAKNKEISERLNPPDAGAKSPAHTTESKISSPTETIKNNETSDQAPLNVSDNNNNNNNNNNDNPITTTTTTTDINAGNDDINQNENPKSNEDPKNNENTEHNDESKSKNKSPPPLGNGGKTDKYVWTQTLDEIEMKLEIPSNCRSKDCVVDIKPKHLSIGIKGEKNYIIKGELHEEVNVKDCTWILDQEYGKNSKTLTLVLIKRKGMDWWKGVIVGDPEIDVKKIEPENSKLDDLDPDTRQTVEKVMFDQRQKMAGKPTSKELEQQEVFERFKKQHPEMDFSKAKFG